MGATLQITLCSRKVTGRQVIGSEAQTVVPIPIARRRDHRLRTRSSQPHSRESRHGLAMRWGAVEGTVASTWVVHMREVCKRNTGGLLGPGENMPAALDVCAESTESRAQVL